MGSLCIPNLSPSTISQKIVQLPQSKSKQLFNTNQPIAQANLSLQLTSNNNQSVYSAKILYQQVIKLPDGSEYRGSTKNGVPHGTGVQYHENKDIYTGQFAEGLRLGNGKYQYASGIVYVGQFNKGDIDGYGKMMWPNGDWYEGEFMENVINGKGRYYSKNSDSYYQGSYLNGKKHGKGTIISNRQAMSGYWDMGQFKYKKFVPEPAF